MSLLNVNLKLTTFFLQTFRTNFLWTLCRCWAKKCTFTLTLAIPRQSTAQHSTSCTVLSFFRLYLDLRGWLWKFIFDNQQPFNLNIVIYTSNLFLSSTYDYDHAFVITISPPKCELLMRKLKSNLLILWIQVVYILMVNMQFWFPNITGPFYLEIR